jgi:hypothetical protein
MSSSLRSSEPSRKGRRLTWTLAVVAALVLTCGLSIRFSRNFDDEESRDSASEISQYLALVQRCDRAGTHAMLGGADSVPADMPVGYLAHGQAPAVESYTIVRAWDWSSMIDGHRGYLVRPVFADGVDC